MATSVTPVRGTNTAVPQGGTAVQVAPAGINGGFIYNPSAAAEQGLTTGDAEPLYVDPVGQCPVCTSGGTITRIEPGQRFDLIPGTVLPTFVNAPTSGHKFAVVTW